MGALWNFANQALSAVLPFAREDGTGREDRTVFVSSVRIGPRQHVLLMLDETGLEIGRVALAGRGHDIAIDPGRGRVVVFARRPGYFALVVDVATCTAIATITPPAGHHFFGHGIFSTDGRLLYATENDFDGERSRGVVGVYDASGSYERIGEFETHGLDAHEILLAPDGRTLVIANGGIETHPDYGRQKLNLAEMRPSIVKIDSRTGDLMDEAVLSATLNRLSTRHMTFDGHGAVWFGCQWEGDRTQRPPLIGRLTDAGAELLDMPDSITPLARNYIGSVVASRDGSTVAASSPIGGQVFLFDTDRVSFRSAIPLSDGCGLASPSDKTFVATAGDGRMVRIDEDGDTAPIARAREEFDNHMRRV